jgi:hypothetical protein
MWRRIVCLLVIVGVWPSWVGHAQDTTIGDVGGSTDSEHIALRVRNKTPFVIIIYVQGKRVGWLKPQNTGVMRGLKRGSHEVYAHSRWGTTYWGPKKLWIPGTWTLYR